MVKKTFRIPEKKFIQLLIAGRLNASLVIDELQTRRITPPLADLKALYDEIVDTNPTYFTDFDIPVDPDWIESLDLGPLFFHRFKIHSPKSLSGCPGAMKILEDPRLVRYILVLCMAGIPRDDLELILNARYDISYDSPDFDVYLKFFANFEGWTYTDKQKYITTVTDKELRYFLQTALTAPRAQVIWELGLGTDPSASFDSMLQDMFTDSYYFFKKKVNHTPDDAQKFAALAIKISDRLESLNDKQREQENIFADLKMKLVEEDTKSATTSKVIDAADLDIEIPEQTTNSIKNLEALMNTDGIENVFA